MRVLWSGGWTNVWNTKKEKIALPKYISFISASQVSNLSDIVPCTCVKNRSAVKPKPVICKQKKGTCNHVVAFEYHYNQTAWTRYEEFLNSQHPITNFPEDS